MASSATSQDANPTIPASGSPATLVRCLCDAVVSEQEILRVSQEVVPVSLIRERRSAKHYAECFQVGRNGIANSYIHNAIMPAGVTTNIAVFDTLTPADIASTTNETTSTHYLGRNSAGGGHQVIGTPNPGVFHPEQPAPEAATPIVRFLATVTQDAMSTFEPITSLLTNKHGLRKGRKTKWMVTPGISATCGRCSSTAH